MRPLLLDIKAFGPYAGHQVIDFSELGNFRFFLIHGPTGSGKTALLDAMCYALYGDTSGKVRSGENMRSDYATDTELTEVTFDFAVGQGLYRVRRSPKQFVARKRGSGLTETGESATLFRLDESLQEVTVLAEKTQKVTAEVQRILGFRSDQFRQVVLLPQGDFRRLLLADSGERQEIMQILFQTEYYSVVEQRLKEAAKTWTEQYAEVDAKLQELQTLAGVESMAELQARIEADEQASGALQGQIVEAAAVVTTARQLLAGAQRDQQAINEQQAATQAFGIVQAESAAMAEKRLELQQAMRAAEVSESVAVAQERKQDREKAEIHWKEAETELTLAMAHQQEASREWESMQAREPELAGLIQKKNALEEFRSKSAALAEAVADAHRFRQQASAAAELLKKAELDLKALQQKLEELQGREARALVLAAETGGRETTFQQWQTARERRKKLDQNRLELLVGEKNLAVTMTAANNIRASLENEREQLEIIQEKWEHEQAALLAAGLVAGAPCPVCGSTEHPAGALPTEGAPDQSVLRGQRQRVDECGKAADEAKQREYSAQAARDSLAHAVALLAEELGEYGSWELERLDAAMESARQAWAEAARARKEAGELQQQGKEGLQKLETAKSDRGAREAAYTAAEARAQAVEAVMQERQTAVPAQYRDVKTLEQRITSVDLQITSLRGVLEKARQSATEAGKSLAQAQAQYDERKGAAERAKNLWEQAETGKRARLAEAGFADEEKYSGSVRNNEARRELDRVIRDFDGRAAAARERMERAAQAAGQITEAPDLAAAEAAYTLANTKEQELRVEAGRILDRLSQARGLILRFSELHAAKAAAEENHALYAGLYEITSGRFTGVSFERYVLGFLLDEVSLYANLRLKEMTRGRYRLRRKENREDKRKGAGLDLEVLDGYTGEARPVQTLSGGETFLASLSLALGLADVVQSRSGGIHLETLFVDEGFGTLDPETLDLAINALQDLQQGGRLVGIISHVPELRERIDARLEIIPVARGSRAEFHVG